MLAVVAGVIFLTELTSNTATTATLVPILAGLASGLGVTPEMFTIPQMAKAGIWLNIIGVILVTTMLYAVILPVLGNVV